MLLLYLTPLLIISFVPFTNNLLLIILYVTSGFGIVGVGMGIMHDAIHGSYSPKSFVNKYLGYTINLIGGSDDVWKIQHNVLHHSYTNIHEADDDINAPFFLRFSPHANKNKLHYYQHIYAWFLYGLSTLSWVASKDFVRLKRYYKMGLVGDKKAYRKTVSKIIFWKIVAFTLSIGLPLAISSHSVGMILLAFFCMHFVAGLSMTVVFQAAHVIRATDFPIPDEKGMIESERFIHQMATTSNFSPKSWLLSWFIGGLNFQVEHHLFPHISHVHYHKIAPIVKQTAEEYGIPYLCEKTFASAIKQHYLMLKELGRADDDTKLNYVYHHH
ncbi:MAG: acyl-CoA desaturase [Cytophagales bacterium]|nr:acyl-CoA desaturase [Cytophagales bacterium]